MFVVVAGLCLILAMIFILYPFLSASRETSSLERNALNVTLHKEYLAGIERQLRLDDIDKATFDLLKNEAEQKLLSDYNDDAHEYKSGAVPRWLGLAVGFIVVAISIGLYQDMGAMTDWRLANKYQQLAKQGEALDKTEYKNYLDEVAVYAPDSPKPKDWWFVTAQGYMSIDEYAQSVISYKQLQASLPEDPSVMASLGQALYLANNRAMTTDARRWLEQALSVEPANTTALGVLGISAFEQADYSKAINYWNKALAVLPPYSRQAQTLNKGVTSAKQALGDIGAVGASSFKTNVAKAVNRRIDVELSLGEGVAFLPEQTVFVFAKAVNGPRFPLAAVKLKASQLPMMLSLDEGDAMQAGISIAQYDKVVVSARLSFSSDPIAAKGDWQSESVSLNLDEAVTSVKLLINQAVE